MKNPNPSSCPKCGASIPEDAPQGLCPKCVLADAATMLIPPKSTGGKTPPPTVAELAPHFPELEILELIGAGGMGAVYKARQPKLDRLVALKILSHDLAADPAFTERFNREARVLARLNHQNIVTVFDFGTQGPFCFLLMEFVDGVNLRQAMRAGGFTPAETLALVQEVCAALKFAHENGILHRDIKPENILIDSGGRVKIADFGIAKMVGENERENVTLTQQGSVLGSPHYMAPEQFESPGDVDQRADIYSLGVVLYEMLTGELPIGRFALPSTKSAMDARIDEIVMRTLEKERELRFQTIGEVKTRMEDVTNSAGPGPQASRAEAAGVAPGRKTARFANAALIFTILSVPVALFALCGFLPLFMRERELLPAGLFILAAFFLVLLGATAGVGMLFGVRAVREIRCSDGKLAGLKRAVASALSWPALLVMLMVLGAIFTMFADNGVGTIWRVLLVVSLLIASGLGVVMILRTLRWMKDPRPEAASGSAHVWRFAATAAMAAICAIGYVREERATRKAYLEPSGTKVTVDMTIPAGKMQTYRVVRIDLKGNETPVDIDGSIVAPVDRHLHTMLVVTTTDRWKESARQKIEASYQALSGTTYKKSAFLDDPWKFTTDGERSAPMDGKKDRLELATRYNWLGKKVETLYLETLDSTPTPTPAPAVEKQPINMPDTSPVSAFCTTRWTLVMRSRGETPESRAALGELCEANREPVFRFLRREGRNEDESRELAQEFFTRLLAGGSIEKADPEKGRFRSYLLGALKHFLADRRRSEGREKRGGGAVIESLESVGTETSPGLQIPDPAGAIPDSYFDREWALAVMDRALKTVEATFAESEKAKQFEILKPWLIGETENLPQTAAAAELGMTIGAIKVAIHRLRKSFRDAIQAEIAQTVNTPDEIATELRYLIEVLS